MKECKIFKENFAYVPIKDIPDQPYLIQSTETEINAAPIAEAEIKVEIQPKPLIEEPDDNYIIEGNTFYGANLTLDGTASYAPEGEPLTYNWSGAVTGTGAILDVFLPIGEHQIILTVSDGILTSNDTLKVIIKDTIPPQVSAEFVPIDEIEEDEGLFEISYSATDICDPNPEVIAAILTPATLADPELELKVEEEIKIEFEEEDDQLMIEEIKGPNPEALWKDIQELGGIRINLGQRIIVEIDGEIEFKSEEGILKIEGLLPILKVAATDNSGNVSEATAIPKFMPEEEEPEEPENPEELEEE